MLRVCEEWRKIQGGMLTYHALGFRRRGVYGLKELNAAFEFRLYGDMQGIAICSFHIPCRHPSSRAISPVKSKI